MVARRSALSQRITPSFEIVKDVVILYVPAGKKIVTPGVAEFIAELIADVSSFVPSPIAPKSRTSTNGNLCPLPR